MRTIYIDENYICHAEAAENRRAVETDRMDGIAPPALPYYYFVPEGEIKLAEDGQAIYGEFVQRFDSKSADAVTRGYEQAAAEALKTAENAYQEGVNSI